MGTKPIRTKRDYRRVLKRIESLMDAKANTADGDRLEVLTTLAAAWEEKHHAIEPPNSPNEAIVNGPKLCLILSRFVSFDRDVSTVPAFWAVS